MFRFNNQDLPTGIDCFELNTTIMPEISLDTIDIHKRYGKFVLSKKLGEKIFEAEVRLRATDKAGIYSLYHQLAQYLYTDEPAVLEITGDEDIYYLALTTTSDITEISPTISTVSITFYCSDPFAYNSDSQTPEALTVGSLTTVNNGGDFPSQPVIEVDVINDSTFLELANKTTNETLLIGAEVVYGEGSNPSYQKYVEIDYDAGQCNDLTKWTNDTGIYDYGSWTGNFKLTTTTIGGSSQVGLECSDYGASTGTSWFGSHAYHVLSEQLDNFSITFDTQFQGNGVNSSGSTECYGYNAIGNRLFKLTLQSMTSDNPVLFFKIYDGSDDSKTCPLLYSGTTGTFTDMDTQKNRPKGYYYSPNNIIRVRIAKRSQIWTVWIAKFESGDDSFSKVINEDTFQFVDKDDVLTGTDNYLDKLVLTASKYSNSTSPSKLIIHSCKIIEELADQDGVPYIIHNGDKIIISSGDAIIYRNGEIFYQYLDPTSDFPILAKGDNSIFINGSSGSLTNCQITKNERYL
jgi:predicted phage tail component-like protein